MKVFNIYLRDRDWLCRVFVAVENYYMDEISEAMISAGCSMADIGMAFRTLGNRPNTGLCYSSNNERQSVMVIARTDSSREFANSMTHEISHLACHIATRDGISLDSEDLCYIVGDIAFAIYPYVSDLLCHHCRKVKQNIRK